MKSPEILSVFFSRNESLIELLIASLRKGNESEGKLAAIVAVLFCIQIGEPDDELFGKFRDALLPIIRDDSQSGALRTSVCRVNPIEFIPMNFSVSVCTSTWFY